MRDLAVTLIQPVHEMPFIDHDGMIVSQGAWVAEVPAQVLFTADAVCRQERVELRILWRQSYSPRRRVRRVGRGTVSSTAMLPRMRFMRSIASCHL